MPRSARRKQLLAAAQEVFVANGYHAAAMDDIAERAGVSKPVLYQHFPGKLELYLALLDTQAEALADAVVDGARGDRRQPASASTACCRPTSTSSTATTAATGAFRLIFETDLGNEPAVRERVERIAAAMQAVADTVAADTGLSAPEAELLATALTGSAQVAARWWLDQRPPGAAGRRVRLLEALLWRGISNFPRQETNGRACSFRSGLTRSPTDRRVADGWLTSSLAAHSVRPVPPRCRRFEPGRSARPRALTLAHGAASVRGPVRRD